MQLGITPLRARFLPQPGLKIVPQVIALIADTQLFSDMFTVSFDCAWGDVQVICYLFGG